MLSPVDCHGMNPRLMRCNNYVGKRMPGNRKGYCTTRGVVAKLGKRYYCQVCWNRRIAKMKEERSKLKG